METKYTMKDFASFCNPGNLDRSFLENATDEQRATVLANTLDALAEAYRNLVCGVISESGATAMSREDDRQPGACVMMACAQMTYEVMKVMALYAPKGTSLEECCEAFEVLNPPLEEEGE